MRRSPLVCVVRRLVWVRLMVPETKGRTLEEIPHDLGMS